jgi:hypothetical protein
MSVEITGAPGVSTLAERFPRIERYLEIRRDGWIAARDHSWEWNKDALSPAELAADYEQWAEFYEWHLAHRAEKLAGDRLLLRAVEQWTDDMAWLSRRCAAYARGEDPGPWIPSWERRPDLDAERRADQLGGVAS